MSSSVAVPTPTSVAMVPADTAEAVMRSPRSADSSQTVTLNALPRMGRAVVVGYAEAGDAEVLRSQRRLAELGFLPGERVQVVARGWFKRGPIAVRVGDSTFALRDDEAAMLTVRAL